MASTMIKLFLQLTEPNSFIIIKKSHNPKRMKMQNLKRISIPLQDQLKIMREYSNIHQHSLQVIGNYQSKEHSLHHSLDQALKASKLHKILKIYLHRIPIQLILAL